MIGNNVDMVIGEVWVDHFDIPVKRFPASWEKYGRRNAEIR